MTTSVYVVPRWGATTQSDWYTWFKEELEAQRACVVRVLDMPNWQMPEIDASIGFLEEQLPLLNQDSYLIGHSVGCQAILHYLTHCLRQGEEFRLGGLLFIAGWFEVDDSWEGLKPWLSNATLNYRGIQQRVDQIQVLLSDDDPFTSDYVRNSKMWAEHLNAQVEVFPNKKHLNESTEEEVLLEFLKMLD